MRKSVLSASSPEQLPRVAELIYSDDFEALVVLSDEQLIQDSGTEILYDGDDELYPHTYGDDELYPHIYGPLNPTWVTEVRRGFFQGGVDSNEGHPL